MKSPFARVVVRILIALMIWTPYQFAQAGMIGTDQVVQQSAHSDRANVMSFVSRADVGNQLAALGLNPATAKDRVAAMSDDEVRFVSGQIDAMPAGADAAGILLLVVVVALIWWAWKR